METNAIRTKTATPVLVFVMGIAERALPRGFDERDEMLAERFQTAGYKTYGFGKW